MRLTTCSYVVSYRCKNEYDVQLIPYIALSVACLSIGGGELFDVETSCHERRDKLNFKYEAIDDLDELLFSTLTLFHLATTEDRCVDISGVFVCLCGFAKKYILMFVSVRISACEDVGVSFSKLCEVSALAAQVIEIINRNSLLKESQTKTLAVILTGRIPTSEINIIKLMTNKLTAVTAETKSQIIDSSHIWQNVAIPSDRKLRARIRLCVATGLIDHFAIRMQTLSPLTQAKSASLSHSELKRYKKAFRTPELPRNEICFLHPTSLLLKAR